MADSGKPLFAQTSLGVSKIGSARNTGSVSPISMVRLTLCLVLSRSHVSRERVKIMGNKLYVGNLSFDTTDQELQAAFAEHGEVVSATVVRDRDTDRSRGFGFVEFAQEADAQTAKEAMNGKELGGRALKVDEARAPKERSRDSGGGGYGRRERW